MKALFKPFDRLRVLALLLWALPVVALLPLGLFWLWRAEVLPWWLLAIVPAAALLSKFCISPPTMTVGLLPQ